MERHVHRPGALDELSGARGIDVRFGVEDSDYDAVGARALCGVDVFEHHGVLGAGIEEVTASGADDDMQADAELFARELDGSGARGETAFEEGDAQLDPLGTAALGGDGAFY